jgi:hypothetical protein
LSTIGVSEARQARLVRIRSTLELEVMLVSEALLPEASANPELRVEGEAEELRFDAEGDLTP